MGASCRVGVLLAITLPFLIVLPAAGSGGSTFRALTSQPTGSTGATDVRPIGSPVLIATWRHAYLGPSGRAFDADGDFIAWAGSGCRVRFLRIPDQRPGIVSSPYCDGRSIGDIALRGSRAVWAISSAGNTEAAASIFTASFGGRRTRSLGGGVRPCDPDGCEFRSPMIDSSGGSLVAQFQVGSYGDGERTIIKRLVRDGRAREVPVAPRGGLAVHGTKIAVFDPEGVELRRLRDGFLLARWGPLPPFEVGPESLALSESLFMAADRKRVDLFDALTGRLEISIPREILDSPAQLVADGAVFFDRRVLRYVSRSGRTSTLANARWRPSQLATAKGRIVWLEEKGSASERTRLYALRIRVVRG